MKFYAFYPGNPFGLQPGAYILNADNADDKVREKLATGLRLGTIVYLYGGAEQ